MFPKIGVPPNHPLKNRVFHEINHPFWGFSPYFWFNTHIGDEILPSCTDILGIISNTPSYKYHIRIPIKQPVSSWKAFVCGSLGVGDAVRCLLVASLKSSLRYVGDCRNLFAL